MTDRELMQMALDALETICGLKSTKLDIPTTMQALRARLAQPEQEPEPYCYTWDVWISGGYWEARYGWEPYCGGKRPEHSTDAKPLYTAPPQREWQGLTDEEIKHVNEKTRSIFVYARAIEAKLKEKNT